MSTVRTNGPRPASSSCAHPRATMSASISSATARHEFLPAADAYLETDLADAPRAVATQELAHSGLVLVLRLIGEARQRELVEDVEDDDVEPFAFGERDDRPGRVVLHVGLRQGDEHALEPVANSCLGRDDDERLRQRCRHGERRAAQWPARKPRAACAEHECHDIARLSDLDETLHDRGRSPFDRERSRRSRRTGRHGRRRRSRARPRPRRQAPRSAQPPFSARGLRPCSCRGLRLPWSSEDHLRHTFAPAQLELVARGQFDAAAVDAQPKRRAPEAEVQLECAPFWWQPRVDD